MCLFFISLSYLECHLQESLSKFNEDAKQKKWMLFENMGKFFLKKL